MLAAPGIAVDHCTYTHGAHVWDLNRLVAKDHYNFRGLSGSQDSIHTEGPSTSVYHYEDYTYLVNLCKSVGSTSFAACDGKPEAAVFQIERGETPHCFALGSAKEMQWGLSVPGQPSKGVALTYSGGEVCHKRVERQVEKPVAPPPAPPPVCEVKQGQAQGSTAETSKAEEGKADATTGAEGAAAAAEAAEPKEDAADIAKVCTGYSTEAECNADSRCTFVTPPPPLPPSPGEKPATYTETVVEWVDVPRKVTINMTCDQSARREDMASIVRMAGKVVAGEPSMCEYVVHWPSAAGCPGSSISGRVHAIGGLNVQPSGWGSTILLWLMRICVLGLCIQLYRDSWRDSLMAALPGSARRFLRAGRGDGSLLPSSSPRKSL
eukprot:COSAG01_NODE_4801_length_4735_cov_3.710095_1_plen_379_part_00